MAAMKPAITVASRPIKRPFLTRKGRGISGFVLRRRKNEAATMQYARQQAKLAASTIHISMTLPNNGANIDRMPKNKMAT